MTQNFGDFTDEDAMEDRDTILALMTPEDIQEMERLSERYKEIHAIKDRNERKAAAKKLVRELNGETDG